MLCVTVQPNDPWGSGAPPGSSNGAAPAVPKGLDDEFDMLSSRSKSPQTTVNNSTTGGNTDETAGLEPVGLEPAGLEPAGLLTDEECKEVEDLFGFGAALSGGGGGN